MHRDPTATAPMLLFVSAPPQTIQDGSSAPKALYRTYRMTIRAGSVKQIQLWRLLPLNHTTVAPKGPLASSLLLLMA